MQATKHFAASGSDVTTGLKRIMSLDLKTSVAGQVDIRLTDVTGQIVIPIAFAAAGEIHLVFASPLVCSDGSFFWDYTSGTWTGSVSGD